MRLNPIGNKIASEMKKVENTRKVDTTKKTKSSSISKTDKTTLSSSAQRLHETRANSEIVSTHIATEPEVRAEKVEEVRKRIKEGYYDSPEFIDKLADKLLSDFGITKKE